VPPAYRKFKRYFATAPSGLHPLGCGGHRAPPSLARVPAAGRRARRQVGSRTADTVPPGRPGPGDRQRTTAGAPDGGVGGAAARDRFRRECCKRVRCGWAQTRAGVQHAAKAWSLHTGSSGTCWGCEQDAGPSALTTHRQCERGPQAEDQTRAAPQRPPGVPALLGCSRAPSAAQRPAGATGARRRAAWRSLDMPLRMG